MEVKEHDKLYPNLEQEPKLHHKANHSRCYLSHNQLYQQQDHTQAQVIQMNHGLEL